ncbi:MAG: hypothetical protein IID44_31690 [Planctomycetes bacterium]|nr:hypothetical protein [Planctomycetota bacterium]
MLALLALSVLGTRVFWRRFDRAGGMIAGAL